MGVRKVEITVDRGGYEVMVQVGRHWYEPFWALSVVDDKPAQQRALNHAERRKYTVEAVRRIRGTLAERRVLRRRAVEYQRAYTTWAEGKGPHP